MLDEKDCAILECLAERMDAEFQRGFIHLSPNVQKVRAKSIKGASAKLLAIIEAAKSKTKIAYDAELQNYPLALWAAKDGCHHDGEYNNF